jgi:hypothetical protein
MQKGTAKTRALAFRRIEIPECFYVNARPRLFSAYVYHTLHAFAGAMGWPGLQPKAF